MIMLSQTKDLSGTASYLWSGEQKVLRERIYKIGKYGFSSSGS